MNNSGNLSDYLRNQAEKNPEKAAVIHPDKITFSDFNLKVDQLSHGLSKIGIRPGMKVILLTKANTEFYILVFALFRIGAVIVMIDPGVGPAIMNTSLREIDADAFIGIPSAHLFRILNRNSFKDIKIIITVGPKGISKGYTLSSLYENSSEPFSSHKINPDDLGGVFFTSGSTGPPKGVLYQNRMFHAQIQLFKNHYKWSPKEIDLCTFPIIGLFSLCLGCTIVIADMNPVKPATLDPRKVWSNLEEFKCTHMFASPMVIRKLNEYAIKHSLKLNHIKRIVTAGAPVPVWLLEEFSRQIPEQAKIHTPYGATEALPVSDAEAGELISLFRSVEQQEAICVGKAIGDNKVRIIPISDKEITCSEEQKELEVDEIGEISVSGSVVTNSYFNQDANLRSKFTDENGKTFHRMGDIGKKDKDGFIWFYGRKNHRVETTSQTLFTIPTEAIFNSLPFVRRTALVGIPEDGTYAKPVICIEPSGKLGKGESEKLLQGAKNLAIEKGLFPLIDTFLIHKNFPVDPRHNAKIFREKLQAWAAKRI